jgi:hypothetical protein
MLYLIFDTADDTSVAVVVQYGLKCTRNRFGKAFGGIMKINVENSYSKTGIRNKT